MTATESASGQRAESPGCYRHPKRETYVRCTRCDRYICGDCTRSAAVGQQCAECVRDGNKTVRRARTITGGRIPSTAVATYSIIIINVLAYVAEIASPGIVNRFSTLGEDLMRNGQLYTYSGHSFPGFQAVGIAHGEWYRLVTGAFLHLLPTQGAFGITHIVFNMCWLWVLGRAIEPVLGSLRFTAVYLLAAVGGSVLGYVLAPHSSAVGASGAIFGLAAAYFVLSRRLNVDASYAARLVGIFLVWMVVSAGVDFWEGHLGGFVAGGAITLAYAYSPSRHRTVIHLAATAGMLVIFAAVVVLKTHQLTG
jgi:membrane associated rhomboid family serine protease